MVSFPISNASRAVRSLELLRTKQRVKQVNEEAKRCDAGNNVIHDSLLKLVAGLSEGPAYKQEQTADCDVKQVEHTIYSLSVTTTW
jgi:hypothetical protein